MTSREKVVPKFQFMNKINNIDKNERKISFNKRNSVEYVPYERDRNSMGQIIRPDLIASHGIPNNVDIDLHKDIQKAAVKKGNDPVRLTTY